LSSLLILVVALSLQAPTDARLRFTPAPDWTPQTVTSTMRVAEFVLPKVGGDAEDGSLIVYYFGGTGGSVQANIDRWFGQLTQPDGRPTKDVAKVFTRRINGLAVTDLDVSGTYIAEVAPGSPERHNKPGFRLRAAVIETPRGPYFIRVVGPAQTVARWASAIETFFQSLEYR
jgi:hypothetical protein